MTNDPDAIRADIEATRRELGSDVDALADKVSPSKIAERQAEKVKGVFRSARDRVMGAADDVQGGVSDATDAVSDAAHTVKAKAEGNPFAVGLIAFGFGLLVSSLIPASTVEKEAASNLKDAAEPLMHEVTDAAKTIGENLKEPAQDAAQAVKSAATDAVSNVKDEAQGAASDLKEHAQDAAAEVTSSAQQGGDDPARY